MSKKLYNIVMLPGVLETDLLENEASGMELFLNPDLFDGLIVMMLTAEEAEVIVASGKVKECLPERQAVETAYPITTPRYQASGATFRTRTYPPTSGNGKNYTGMNMFFTSEFDPASGFAGSSAGYFGDFNFDDAVKTNFAGDYVDIVAVEAGSSVTSNAGHEDHPDFEEFDSNNTKFIPMDWSDISGAMSSTQNNQVTNGSTNWFSNHAIGVLSAAGGKYCGWGKKSTLRVIYLDTGVAAAYYAVLSWHISKAVNPVTGVRNATVVTGAWGYSGVEHERFYRCDHIQSLDVFNKDTGVNTVINRPGSDWGDDLTPFTDNLFVPRVIEDPGSNVKDWYISVPDQTRASFFDTVMSQYNSYNGIYHFKSAGNNAHVAVNPDDPRWDNKIIVGTGADGVINTLDSQGRNQFTTNVVNTAQSFYILRSEIDGGDNQFTIGACQQDDTNRLMDDYSNRGPQIDFTAYGAYTWTSNPVSTYLDGDWGYFSGTSCAAPVAAGCAAVFLDHWFTQRGVYPSIAQLKALMIKHAKENLIGEDLIDFSNTPTAGDIASTKLYFSSDVNSIKDNDYQNGGADLTELYGTPALRVHIPWGIRMGSGKYIAGGSEQTANGRRPESGRTWPRQKNAFSV